MKKNGFLFLNMHKMFFFIEKKVHVEKFQHITLFHIIKK